MLRRHRWAVAKSLGDDFEPHRTEFCVIAKPSTKAFRAKSTIAGSFCASESPMRMRVAMAISMVSVRPAAASTSTGRLN